MIELKSSRDKVDLMPTALGKDEDFKCFVCGKLTKEGFICENVQEKFEEGKWKEFQKVICLKCHPDFPMHRCKHDINNEHKHIKFIRGLN